jgi:curved DNA-binding protein CbpA
MSQTSADPYVVLGIARSASQQQAARAYRRLAKRYHPDLHRDGQSAAQMRRVNQAWEILSSPARRSRYDADHAPPGYSDWSAPRRSVTVAPTSAIWNSAWAAPPPSTRPYSPPPYRDTDEADGQAWPGAVLLVAFGAVVLVALFAGILPFPLVGIAFLVLARGVFGRFDDRMV